MLEIPIQPIPSQLVKSVLDGQNCQIAIYEKEQGVFVDVQVDGAAMAVATLAHDAVPLVPRLYAGFKGNLLFLDTQGADDPTASGMGSRFVLLYLTADEYALVR